MKVIAFNGSPRTEGNTFIAIKTVLDQMENKGIETEVINVGKEAVRGCIACNQCAKNKNEQCVIQNDKVNEWIQKMKEADGIIIGSPVYFAGVNGTMKSFLDRAFYVCSSNGNLLRHKVGAAVVAVRRSGGLTTFNQLNHYLTYAELFMPTTNYWNVIHGTKPADALQDEEGIQIMRILGKNFAYLLETIKNDDKQRPDKEKKRVTNFIR